MDEADYWRVRYEDASERLGLVAVIASRGLVSPCAWKKINETHAEPFEWYCSACFAKQGEPGPCLNPVCVPGAVARALARETSVARRLNAMEIGEGRVR